MATDDDQLLPPEATPEDIVNSQFPGETEGVGPEPLTSETPVSETSSQATNNLMAIEGLIAGKLSHLQNLQDELTRYTEMLNDILVNNPTYSEAAEAAKEATKVKTAAKKEALKHPQAAELNAKLKDIKGLMKDIRSTLSDTLDQYRQMTGSNTYEDEAGEVRQIVTSAKLVKRS